jgi:NHL repeat
MHGTAHVAVFASGFNNPRGLTFGPNGDLYVAEGGRLGDAPATSTSAMSAYEPTGTAAERKADSRVVSEHVGRW